MREKIDAALDRATPEVRRKVLFENARERYKVDPPDITPPVRVG